MIGNALLQTAVRDLAAFTKSGSLAARAFASAGLVLLLSAVLHGVVAAISERPWAGPLAWRKPILFAGATGVTCLSLAWVWNHFRSTRFNQALAIVAAAAALAEVALITIQTWRGVASHFNTSTPLDASIHYAIDALVTILALAILWATWGSFGRGVALRLPIESDTLLAMRIGMSLLLAAVAFGYWMLWHGAVQIAAGHPPETYGRAGVVKFVHGMSMHAIQILPIAVWFLRYHRVHRSARYRLVATWGVGSFAATLFAIAQTFRGRDRLDLDLLSGGLLVVVVALHVLPLFSLWRPAPPAAVASSAEA